jgi:hypothetical protein
MTSIDWHPRRQLDEMTEEAVEEAQQSMRNDLFYRRGQIELPQEEAFVVGRRRHRLLPTRSVTPAPLPVDTATEVSKPESTHERSLQPIAFAGALAAGLTAGFCTAYVLRRVYVAAALAGLLAATFGYWA